MATLNSSVLTSNSLYTPFPMGDVGVRSASIAVGTGLAANDVLNFVTVKKGERILGVSLVSSTSLDTNETQALSFDIGYAYGSGDDEVVDADGFVDGSAVAGLGIVSEGVMKGLTFPVDGKVTATVAADAGTAAEGTLTLSVIIG